MTSKQSLGAVLGEINAANAAILRDRDQGAVVQLDPDHPGFRDQSYRARRNAIAEIALKYEPGTEVPDVNYTPEEHDVWRIVCDHLLPKQKRLACKAYLEGAARLELPNTQLPQLRDVSARLQQVSGFRLEPAAGLVDPRVFLCTLGEGIFLSTQYIRHPSTPLYTPEPDVVHELLGHAVTLAHPQLAEVNRMLGQAAQRTDSDIMLEKLGRIYWYTIEFGVLMEDNKPKAYGAGLLSSAGELERIETVELRPFDLNDMIERPYDVTQYQPFLYCAASFEEMLVRIKDYLGRWPHIH
ncbi:MAG: phenylalanine 4-monooxygenase [Myxococcales bacterium]|nr:phenylalanine 4-monooxygenase [Myxococcales bacterium]